MLKKIIDVLSNPILFYADKSGNAVFRNFCWFKNTGCLYKLKLSKPEVGGILEYRFGLEKYLKTAYILIPIIMYFIFIHLKYSIWNILLCEFWWIVLVFICQGICSYIYSDYLVKNFGPYELVDFRPNLSQEKKAVFRANFNSKIIIILIAVLLFSLPSFVIRYAMKLNISKRKFPAAITISKIYLSFYPRTEAIFDMRAYARYMKHDYEGALKDYKTALEMSGKRFGKKDFARFANLLLLEKKLSTPENAVDVFNDYVTRKKMSTLEESQMLWIKSIFRIENNSPESIIADYDNLLASLNPKDAKNQFYISSDKAYMYYLMQDYENAINIYNILITYAEANKKQYEKELQSLYAERGFARKNLGDIMGSDSDFMNSKIDPMELDKYEPSFNEQEFVVDKF